MRRAVAAASCADDMNCCPRQACRSPCWSTTRMARSCCMCEPASRGRRRPGSGRSDLPGGRLDLPRRGTLAVEGRRVSPESAPCSPGPVLFVRASVFSRSTGCRAAFRECSIGSSEGAVVWSAKSEAACGNVAGVQAHWSSRSASSMAEHLRPPKSTPKLPPVATSPGTFCRDSQCGDAIGSAAGGPHGRTLGLANMCSRGIDTDPAHGPDLVVDAIRHVVTLSTNSSESSAVQTA